MLSIQLIFMRRKCQSDCMDKKIGVGDLVLSFDQVVAGWFWPGKK